LISGQPPKPKLVLDSAESHALNLAIESAASVLWCTVSHKPMFGTAVETTIPAKDLERFRLRNLQVSRKICVGRKVFRPNQYHAVLNQIWSKTKD
jgi:hypothetical protein